MSVFDVAKRAPSLGRDMLTFLLYPKHFVTSQLPKSRYEFTNKEALAWSFGASALFFGLYPLLTGHSVVSVFDTFMGVAPPTGPIRSSTPTFGQFGVSLEAGVGVMFPKAHLLGLTQPQPAIFSFGPGKLLVNDVVPSKIGTKVAGALLLNIYVYFGLLCIYPATTIWKRSVPLPKAVWLATFAYCISWLLVSASILLQAMTIDVLSLRASSMSLSAWVALVLVSVALPFALLVRCFWTGFRTLFDLTRKKFATSLFLAWLLSYAVFPVALLCVFLVLKFQGWLDLLL